MEIPNEQNRVKSTYTAGGGDIWVLAQHWNGRLQESTLGLIGEARRLRHESQSKNGITTIMFDCIPEEELQKLSNAGADTVVCFKGETTGHFHGELFTELLLRRVQEDYPALILSSHAPESDDLIPRLAAHLQAPAITRAIDCHMSPEGTVRVVRPHANGFRHQSLTIAGKTPCIVSFDPAVLTPPEAAPSPKTRLVVEQYASMEFHLDTTFIGTKASNPEDQDLEEAHIIVAGGQGLVADSAFDLVHNLAKAVGGCVGATRPIIDRHILNYEHQIGQTGKTVSPDLIINCGISGASEYTAGMGKAKLVIAIDKNPRARIFQFADLGIIADATDVIPRLISTINKGKTS